MEIAKPTADMYPETSLNTHMHDQICCALFSIGNVDALHYFDLIVNKYAVNVQQFHRIDFFPWVIIF